MEIPTLYYPAQGVGGSGQQHGQSIISASVHLGIRNCAPQFGQVTSINGIRSFKRSLLLFIKSFTPKKKKIDTTILHNMHEY